MDLELVTLGPGPGGGGAGALRFLVLDLDAAAIPEAAVKVLMAGEVGRVSSPGVADPDPPELTLLSPAL